MSAKEPEDKFRMTLKIVLLEQRELSDSPDTACQGRSRRYLPPQRAWAQQYTFKGLQEFEVVLARAGQELLRTDEQTKLLIISAHGEPHTGVQICVGNGELLDFWDYREYFRPLPSNLIIYVNCCFGLYPSAAALQGDAIPLLVGP